MTNFGIFTKPIPMLFFLKYKTESAKTVQRQLHILHSVKKRTQSYQLTHLNSEHSTFYIHETIYDFSHEFTKTVDLFSQIYEIDVIRIILVQIRQSLANSLNEIFSAEIVNKWIQKNHSSGHPVVYYVYRNLCSKVLDNLVKLLSAVIHL